MIILFKYLAGIIVISFFILGIILRLRNLIRIDKEYHPNNYIKIPFRLFGYNQLYFYQPFRGTIAFGAPNEDEAYLQDYNNKEIFIGNYDITINKNIVYKKEQLKKATVYDSTSSWSKHVNYTVKLYFNDNKIFNTIINSEEYNNLKKYMIKEAE